MFRGSTKSVVYCVIQFRTLLMNLGKREHAIIVRVIIETQIKGTRRNDDLALKRLFCVGFRPERGTARRGVRLGNKLSRFCELIYEVTLAQGPLKTPVYYQQRLRIDVYCGPRKNSVSGRM